MTVRPSLPSTVRRALTLENVRRWHHVACMLTHGLTLDLQASSVILFNIDVWGLKNHKDQCSGGLGRGPGPAGMWKTFVFLKENQYFSQKCQTTFGKPKKKTHNKKQCFRCLASWPQTSPKTSKTLVLFVFFCFFGFSKGFFRFQTEILVFLKENQCFSLFLLALPGG